MLLHVICAGYKIRSVDTVVPVLAERSDRRRRLIRLTGYVKPLRACSNNTVICLYAFPNTGKSFYQITDFI